MSTLRNNASVNEERIKQLLQQQADIQAQLASLLPASAPTTSHHHRSPIHKHQHRRQSHVPRSMSNSGASMARTSSDRIEAPAQQRSLSQRSAPGMARTSSRGTASSRTGNLPFTQTGTMPPPLHAEPRRDNPAMEAWARQDQPLSSYTFSHQPQLQRSASQRKSELEQVQELDNVGEDPAEFILRTQGLMRTPSLSITPSPVAIPSATPTRRHRLSTSSRHSFNIPTPSTPTTDSLTNATTLTSSMSRQNSLYNEPLLEGIEMMKVNSNASYLDVNFIDHPVHDQVYNSSHHHSRRSSNEEQAQLLVGAGASHDSLFSHSYSASQAADIESYGEMMEKSHSIESTSSMSSTSRSKQRLQAAIALSARQLKPKGGEDNAMSRDHSSQSISRLQKEDKVAISKPTYQRPKHDRVYCKQCDDHPDGFRGEHELRRHQDRQHKRLVKKWVCIEPAPGSTSVKPVLPLSRCKACGQQKKKYGAYYNAAAHLRRTHFKPKAKGRSKSTKLDDAQKRGGKAGGDWPPMSELKNWMKEVEEYATDYGLTASQQDEADEVEEDDDENILTEPYSMGGSFDTSFADQTFNIFPPPAQQFLGMQAMPLDITGQNMSFNNCQSSFDNSFPLMSNDPLASFLDQSSFIPNFVDEQSPAGLELVNFPYLS